LNGLEIVKGGAWTNMLFFRITSEAKNDCATIKASLKEKNILVGTTGPNEFRLVTHYWINDQDVEKTIQALAEVI
jgi:threonine aldolase